MEKAGSSTTSFIERLWRTVKYEEVYLKEYAHVWEAVRNLKDYFRRYNEERIHTAIGDGSDADASAT